MDEKMIRAVLAGHALEGLLASNAHLDSACPAKAVLLADALLVELKKDSPAPAPESAPPLADEARVPGDVSIGDRSDAPSAAADAPPATGPHEHRVCNPDDAEVVARSPLSFESQVERFKRENPPRPSRRCAGLNKAARVTCNSPSVHVEIEGKWFCKRHNPGKPKKARAA